MFKGKCALMHTDPSCQMTVVDELTTKFTKMNKNHAEIKGELSDLKKNVDRKALDAIKKIDS